MTQETPAVAAENVEGDGSSAPHTALAVDTLRRAMRRARYDNAERAGALAELRSTSLGRLELLHEALKPLIAQIPPDADLFDIGLMPGATPRLFIDMIGFVEMGRDARLYRLVQDTRHGRLSIAESETLTVMVDAITDYVARRLLERDRALAADARFSARPARPNGTDEMGAQTGSSALPVQPAGERRRPSRLWRWLVIGFAFIIDLLGSIAFFTLVALLGWLLWNRLHAPVG